MTYLLILLLNRSCDRLSMRAIASSTNYHLLITMTINIKITAPVYRANEYGGFDRGADIEIAGDFDSFTEGYVFLRTQIDELLKQSNADNTLLLNLEGLQAIISSKERTLERVNRSIEIAQDQLRRLHNFLERLGIDPDSYSLVIADKPIVSAVAVEAEVDPIPFDLEAQPDNDEF